MENNLFQSVYNPDVLSCIANLSNDEVFTPPELANRIIDMLPEELFRNPDTTFLDPCCKSGVFLREIAKRLIKGLEPQIPDLERRIEHIFSRQLFGIAITELTSLLSRRSVYCSKYPSGEFSVHQFPESQPQGNIIYQRIPHTWSGGKCIYCGASQSEYDRGAELETHAYQFIHNLDVKKLFNMKFDVIIGNPPYQLSDGGAQASAKPIYNLFIEQAMKLNPRYLTMIIPARWYTGGKGLDLFRDNMINDKRIKVLHDYVDASECFSGVEIKGGVCYFLWDNQYLGECDIYKHKGKNIELSRRYLVEKGENIFIRENKLISIMKKVWANSNIEENSFETIVSSMKPYGLRGDFFKSPTKYGLPNIKDIESIGDLRILGLEGSKRVYRYIPQDYPLPKRDLLNSYKIFIPRNVGIGEFGDFTPTTVIASPKDLCTETFIQVGPFKSINEANNADDYIHTKFFRALVSIRKQDQGASKAVYHFVPLQDFSKSWTDEELYAKYGLTQEEIEFIESMIRPME
ncbi:MAG: Eco57I restriction-modification methylase domain-containing protein [Bacteroidaceae bacterium]|nr:Eco57I restriction-modification methylase domain-containing protein [Bacteroidaceae bacterium]